MTKLPTVALDTCCIIDWLKNKPECAKEADAIAELFDEMHRGERTVVISVAVIVEIFPKKHEDDKRYGEYRRLLRGSKLTVIPMDTAVAETVAYLREALQLTSPKKRMDTIHLGTAIHAGAKYLYTRDKGLLKLNEKLSVIDEEHKPVKGFAIRAPSKESLV